jgi:hypothetical protein
MCHQISDGRLEKFRLVNIGRHHSVKTKKQMSITRKGTVPWNKGLTDIYSENTRKKNSVSHKLLYQIKENHPRYNRHHTTAAKNKISESGKKIGSARTLKGWETRRQRT